jgi:hypothetical protein
MTQGRDEEIAASVGAHRDLGDGYDDAIAAGLVERIGAEVDRRVDERMSQYERGTRQPRRLPGAHSEISWQQVGLALGSMVIGLIASVSITTPNGTATWPIIVIWAAIVAINMVIFRVGRRIAH